MSINVNYKLLDDTNNTTKPVDQLLFIFNKLYGGDSDNEISDSVALVAEAGILDIAATHKASDFYENRAGVEYEIFQRLQQSFKDYYLKCTSVFILNIDFDSQYMNSILKVMAESQKIQEKTNLLNGTTIQSQTLVEVAKIDQKMSISRANAEGQVYTKVQQSKASAVVIYNGKLKIAVDEVATFLAAGQSVSNVNKFFYLVVKTFDIGNEDDPFSKGLVLVQPYRPSYWSFILKHSNSCSLASFLVVFL